MRWLLVFLTLTTASFAMHGSLKNKVSKRCSDKLVTSEQMSFTFQWKMPEQPKQLVAVHTFSTLPQNGRLVSTALTTHFALGGLTSKMLVDGTPMFALVRPLKSLLPKVCRLDAFDTVVIGDVIFEPGDIVVGPEIHRDKFPSIVKYMVGDVQGVDRAVQELSGFQLKFLGISMDGSVVGAGSDAFNKELKKVSSLNQHFAAGEQSVRLVRDIETLMADFARAEIKTVDLQFQIAVLQILARELKLTLPALYAEMRDTIGRLHRLLQLDIHSRSDFKLSFSSTARSALLENIKHAHHFDALLATYRGYLKDLNDEALGNRDNLPTDSRLHHSLQEVFVDVNQRHLQAGLGTPFLTSLISVPISELTSLTRFLKDLNGNSFEVAKFRLRHAVARTVLVGTSTASREGLLSSIAVDLKIFGRKQDLEEARKYALDSRLLGLHRGAILAGRGEVEIRDALRNLYRRLDEYNRVTQQIQISSGAR